jgi:hypothetical protein
MLTGGFIGTILASRFGGPIATAVGAVIGGVLAWLPYPIMQYYHKCPVLYVTVVKQFSHRSFRGQYYWGESVWPSVYSCR